MASRIQVSPKRVASNLGLSWAGTALFSPSANKGSTQVLWLQGPGTEVHIPQVGTFFGSFGKEEGLEQLSVGDALSPSLAS